MKGNEGEVSGGEEEFIKKMILESMEFKDEIKIFSSLVGKGSTYRLIS